MVRPTHSRSRYRLAKKPTDNRKPLFAISIDQVPSLVTTVGAVSITLAVANHLGFFLYIGPSMLMSTMNLEDFVRNSIHAIPVTLFFWGIGILLAESKKSENSKPRSKWLSWLVTPDQNPIGGLKVSALFCLFFYAMFEDWPLYMGVFFLWAASLNLIGALRNRLPEAPADLLFGIFLVVLAFLNGVQSGYRELLSSKPNVLIEFADNTTLPIKLVKITSESLIVLKSLDELQVIPRSEVKSITYNLTSQKYVFSSGFLMRAFGHLKKMISTYIKTP
jgi:hypothetical protein